MANKSYRRTRNLFDPRSGKPYRLSRSRLENFIGCPRCFYMDRRLGVEPPGMPSFTLNSAVDQLLKNEFDGYRREQKTHPLMQQFGFDGIPFSHPSLEQWRDVFTGVQYHHRPTNFILFGAIDDLWVDRQGRVAVVDYKATSTNEPITLDSPYRQAYKRQLDIYRWLLEKQNLNVSSTGYFLYCNGDKNRKMFGGKLEFSMEIIPCEGETSWVEEAVLAAHRCLMADQLPESSPECAYCHYRKESTAIERQDLPVSEAQGELFEGFGGGIESP